MFSKVFALLSVEYWCVFVEVENGQGTKKRKKNQKNQQHRHTHTNNNNDSSSEERMKNRHLLYCSNFRVLALLIFWLSTESRTVFSLRVLSNECALLEFTMNSNSNNTHQYRATKPQQQRGCSKSSATKF